jgi:hypothetical protein
MELISVPRHNLLSQFSAKIRLVRFSFPCTCPCQLPAYPFSFDFPPPWSVAVHSGDELGGYRALSARWPLHPQELADHCAPLDQLPPASWTLPGVPGELQLGHSGFWDSPTELRTSNQLSTSELWTTPLSTTELRTTQLSTTELRKSQLRKRLNLE